VGVSLLLQTLTIFQGPLGAGALAGNCFGVDREAMAKELGFDGLVSRVISVELSP
jgi:argininosuccinate lyase